LLKEELDVERYAYESGRVKVHKAVKVEDRHFTVPVRREEIVVEHLAAKDWEPAAARSATSSSTAFEDQVTELPLYEEDIRVSKRPIVREEVVVRTVAHSVDIERSESLRSEEAEVEDTRSQTGSLAPGAETAWGYGYASAPPARH